MEKIQTVTTKNGTTYQRKGRPLRYEGQMYIRLPKDHLEMFKIIAKKENTTMGEICRRLIENYIKENI